MQARRLLLVIGIVMLFAVVAASLVPPPEETQESGSTDGETTEPLERQPVPSEDRSAIEVEFGAESPSAERNPGRGTQAGGATGNGATQTKTVRLGKRVIVTVTPSGPGTVELEGLGRLQVAARGNPAVFDLFTDRPGRFAVLFTPSEGSEQMLGSLVVERPPSTARGDRRPAR